MSTFNVATKVSSVSDFSVVLPNNGNVDLFTVPANTVYKINALVLKDVYVGTTLLLRLKTTDGTYISNYGDLKNATDDPIYNSRATLAGGALLVFKQPLIVSAGQGLNIIASGNALQTRNFAVFGDIIVNTV